MPGVDPPSFSEFAMNFGLNRKALYCCLRNVRDAVGQKCLNDYPVAPAAFLGTSGRNARLDPVRFFCVHRSAIVNLDRVREVQFLFRGEHVVILHDGTKLKLSRGRLDKLEAMLAGR